MQITNVWVNGCFDVLHIGHIRLLQYARSLGNRLVVGIDTDNRVAAAKGDSRPFNNVYDRKSFLEELQSVDSVVTYSTNRELEDLLVKNDISVMVVGSDWEDKEVVGEKLVKKVVFFDRIGEYSTTRILNNEIHI
jgi:rfaE bifunctional protein nucleotidyltransferase chain/domain